MEAEVRSEICCYALRRAVKGRKILQIEEIDGIDVKIMCRNPKVMRFASGSKDGTIKVKYSRSTFTTVDVDVDVDVDGMFG